MSSAALYEVAVTFLEADVLATVNQEQPGLLGAKAVTAARSAKRRFARRDKSLPAAVEIVFVKRREEAEGLNSDRVHLEFDLRCIVCRKDASEGKQQARVADDMARALVRRFRRATELPLAAPGVAFRSADAAMLHVDEEPDSGEVARSVVHLTLTFSEALA